MPGLLLSSADGLVSRRVLVPQHLSHLGVSSCTWSPFNRLLLLLFAPPPPSPSRHWLQLERGPYLVSRLLHEIRSFLRLNSLANSML